MPNQVNMLNQSKSWKDSEILCLSLYTLSDQLEGDFPVEQLDSLIRQFEIPETSPFY